ncbi:MAG: GNAT family protein [Oscillospiraceae bacterium]
MKLRKLEEKDISRILTWMKDPQQNCFFQFDADTVSADSVEEFVKEAQNTQINLHLACVDDNDDYLGTISLKNIDHKNKNAEYAISFSKSAHGTGAAYFATKEILRIAFETLQLNKIYLNVLAYNTRAIRFYEKLGFVFEGEFRQHVFIHGNPENLKWYSYLKEDFEYEDRG